MGSDHGCDCKGSGDDVPSGGGEGAGWGQITDATAKRAGRMHKLEVEREWGGGRAWRWRGNGMGSDDGCDCKGSGDNVQAGGGEGAGWGQITDATGFRDGRNHMPSERWCLLVTLCWSFGRWEWEEEQMVW